MVSVSECCMTRGRSLSGNVGGRGLGAPNSHIRRIIVEVQPLTMSYNTEKLAWHQHLAPARFISTFGLQVEPAATCL